MSNPTITNTPITATSTNYHRASIDEVRSLFHSVDSLYRVSYLRSDYEKKLKEIEQQLSQTTWYPLDIQKNFLNL